VELEPEAQRQVPEVGHPVELLVPVQIIVKLRYMVVLFIFVTVVVLMAAEKQREQKEQIMRAVKPP
jgi:hypothetical protein